MERHLLTVADERYAENVLHVSDLVKNTWCPRMLYYRLTGIRPDLDPHSFQFQNILDYGSDAHEKFQRRWRDMGVLYGRWKCLRCGNRFLAFNPPGCEKCESPKACLQYLEVPLAEPDYLLVGNADAEVRDDAGNVLVEIKTVGEGTFRIEAPKTYMRYMVPVAEIEGDRELKYFDIARLWKDLNRPLASHARQGQTYLEMRRRQGGVPVDGIVFLYEHKGNQGLREFEVLPDAEVAQEVFDRAYAVTWAMNRGAPPRCSEGRGGCKLCEPYEEMARRGGNTSAPKRRPVYSGGIRVG